MRNVTKYVVFTALAIFCLGQKAHGINPPAHRAPADSVAVVSDGNVRYFSLRSNEMKEAVMALLESPDYALDKVTVRSGASPSGDTTRNKKLSEKRVKRLSQGIQEIFPRIPSGKIVTENVGEDWERLLYLLNGSSIPHAEEAARIIKEVPVWVFGADGKIISSRKKQLMDLSGGSVWFAMEEELFPVLTKGLITISFTRTDSQAAAPSEQADGSQVTDIGEQTDGFPASESGQTEVQKWQLPRDSRASEPYNKHFKPGEVLGGNPSLTHPSFADNQNLLGVQRSADLGGVPGARKFSEEFTLFFRRNKTDLDEGYLWNPVQISNFRNFVHRDIIIDSVTVFAYASPEGHYGHNVWLSRKRAETARGFILDNSGMAPSMVAISQQEENWPGLRQAVRNFYDRENKQDVLRILTVPGLSDPQRKKHLMDLDGGKTYEYLIDSLMPPLRSAIFTMQWQRKDMLFLPQMQMMQGLAMTDSYLLKPKPQEQWAKRTIVALKTNLLYDAVTALNYQIEVPLGERFSLEWEHYFPWWHSRKELKYCLQYLSLGGEARWWFSPKPKPETPDRMLRDALQGHFLGVYGMFVKTDIQWKRELGMYQCYPAWSAGLTYGYSFPLTKHWNMELSISAGYARIPYQHYIPSDDWQVLWRDRNDLGVLHYFGPTKINVAIVRPILIKYRKRR